MSGWRRIVGEAHQRSLWQVLGIYLVAGWAVFQVVVSLHEVLGLPIWVPRLALVLLLIGLPIVLATAFVQEGVSRSASARGTNSDLGPNGSVSGGSSHGLSEPEPAVTGETMPPGTAQDSITARPARTASDSIKTAPAPAAGLLGLFTWRRSLLGGVAAFALLAVLTTVFMFVRARNTLVAQGVLDEQDVIVLADFVSAGADPTLGTTVTEALRIDLVTSDIIRLADPARIAAVLARMQREASEPLSSAVAREVALRDGIKAVLTGEIGSVGGGYLLTAQLVTPADSPLAAFRSTARDSTGLIDAIDDLSRQVRDKIGESLKTINAKPALYDVSTRSLPALRKYVESERLLLATGDYLTAAELLGEAIALDSSFAMAWRKKGVYLNYLSIRRDEAVEALTRAVELQDRLPEKERHLAAAGYATYVSRDADAAIDAYKRVLAIDPDDYVALNNIGIALGNARRYTEAESYLEHGTQLPQAAAQHFANLVATQYRLGRFDEARATLERGQQKFPGTGLQRYDAIVAAADNRWGVIDSIARAYAERDRDNGAAQVFALTYRLRAAVVHGRLADAASISRELDNRAAAGGLLPQRLLGALALAEISLRVRGDQARGLREIDEALRQFPLDSIPVSERPYDVMARLYADAERFDDAQAMIERGMVERPPDPNDDPPTYSWTRAYIALRRGDATQGIEQYRIASSYPEDGSCRVCDLHVLGQAYEVAGRPDSARAVYDRYLDIPFFGRLNNAVVNDWIYRPFVLERVAELHDLAGDTTRARERYAEFVGLWQDADPELQSRVEAARRRLAALGGVG